MTKEDAKKIMSYLFAAYPKADLGSDPDITIALWKDTLKVFPYEVAQEAARIWLFEGNKWFPVLAEFIKVCGEVWQKKSNTTTSTPTIEDLKVRDRASKTMTRKCNELVEKRMKKEISMVEYIEELKKLDRDYPGLGFDLSALKLTQEYL